MKTAILAALLLSACATVSTSPAQFSTMPNGRTAAISGSATQTFGFLSTTYDVDIKIDGQSAAAGRMETGSAEFHGKYDGLPVLADCSLLPVYSIWTGMRYDVKCIVNIEGRRVAALILPM